ncbi:MAG: DEAD/DEAH box helicase [archaeon]
MKLFEEFGLSHELLNSIKKLGFDKPTEIQEGSIPYILEGRDVIGESATGSGKTLAFACGIVKQVIPKQGLQALILTPTRELAEQVKDHLKQISHNLNIISIYGGVSIDPQIYELQKTDVVVGTPGRILDHINRRTINFSKIKLVVLDEADRMFDMGFIDDVKQIIRTCPTKRQTLIFSATISSKVKEVASKYMINPVEILAEKMVDPSKLKQVYYDVPKNIKLSLLIHLLKHEESGLVMVFCNTRRTTDLVVKNLQANRFNAIAIHGGFTQNKRTKTMQIFNSSRAEILVCTDVAARGLHIENVSHIYNYEIPKDPKDYIHRIGRTARAGESGKAVNLLCDYDYENFSRILEEYRGIFTIEKLENPYVERVMFIQSTNRRSEKRPFQHNQHGRNRSNTSERYYGL